MPPTKVARECWGLIHRLVFEGEAQGRMADACSFAGVPPGVLKTLIHLDPDRATPMRDLAGHFGVDASYITALVDELEQAGLAERRTHDHDRRVKTVALTNKGQEVRARVEDVMGAPPSCFAALSTGELRALRAMLSKAIAADPVAAEGEAVFHARRA